MYNKLCHLRTLNTNPLETDLTTQPDYRMQYLRVNQGTMLSESVLRGPNKDHSSGDAATRLSYLMAAHIIYSTPLRCKFAFSYAYRSQYGWIDSGVTTLD